MVCPHGCENPDYCESCEMEKAGRHGCSCCDPTADSPDPVVRLEREVAELKLRLSCEEVSHNKTNTMLNKYRFELMTERDEARKELAAIREVIHELNPLRSDGPLPYRVKQLCDDLAATRREWERLREDNSRLSKACARSEGVWVWQGDGNDHPESLTCQVLMTANQVRTLTEASATLRGLLREACDAALYDYHTEEWHGNEIPSELFVRAKASLEGKQ